MGTINPSTQAPTVGRIVHVWSTAWAGPRPGIVVQLHPNGRCNINTFVDGSTDAEALAEWRRSPDGNTLVGLEVFALAPRWSEQEIDEELRAGDIGIATRGMQVVATWPPR